MSREEGAVVVDSAEVRAPDEVGIATTISETSWTKTMTTRPRTHWLKLTMMILLRKTVVVLLHKLEPSLITMNEGEEVTGEVAKIISVVVVGAIVVVVATEVAVEVELMQIVTPTISEI